jgi:hypothetical protein
MLGRLVLTIVRILVPPNSRQPWRYWNAEESIMSLVAAHPVTVHVYTQLMTKRSPSVGMRYKEFVYRTNNS